MLNDPNCAKRFRLDGVSMKFSAHHCTGDITVYHYIVVLFFLFFLFLFIYLFFIYFFFFWGGGGGGGGLRLYVRVNYFSVMLGRSHRFLDITSTF